MTDLDAVREPLERIAAALEDLVRLATREVESARKIHDLATRHERELRRNLQQLVDRDVPAEEPR